MYPNTIALARRLSKSIVAYDLEHTGGAKGSRAITDFGAMLVTPDGDVSSYTSLVKPPDGTPFNPIVCRLTGIYPNTVKNAPGWEKVVTEFILPNHQALWVGFNSRTCDTPVVYSETRRVGHELAPVTQLDLMRIGNLEGSLSKRVAQLVPGFDTSGAHRALEDAVMTLVLLEAQLPDITSQELADQLAPPPPNSALTAQQRQQQKRRLAGVVMRKGDVTQFLVKEGATRHGAPWTEFEVSWIRSQFLSRKKTVDELAMLNGRTSLANACALHKHGVISDADRDRYRPA
ncbi:3'-5' exonuclease [Paraburkholderia aspalathi]|nr:3'-5' exonuclease [Paraburkholderia aspalathi]MBK3780027.1 3'-5' exonuclease [Paraburkholderia aspalathi]